jgi:hypothetical protein
MNPNIRTIICFFILGLKQNFAKTLIFVVYCNKFPVGASLVSTAADKVVFCRTARGGVE